MLSFPPFRLDPGEEQLWKGTKLVAVRRKPFAILRYLVSHPRRLVTHDELLKEVWGGSVVSESSVRTHLHELRQVLGEGLIETVIGRGYRFTGEVSTDGDVPAPAAIQPQQQIIGRTGELDALGRALERVRGGQRQIVFVTGDPGIGKTTLVDAFLETLTGSDVFAMRGGWVEQHSAPEAYRPIIEMVSRLRPGEPALAALLRHAPTFLAQLPHCVPEAQLDDVRRRAAGGTEARLVRELVEALEAASTVTPHVIVLEDLQWSDVATIDLLAILGQRRERAKLLVIATSRCAEASTVTHPINHVMRTLVARNGAITLALDRLDPQEVARFVEARCPGHTFPARFVTVVDTITAGTPLFLAAVLDDLVAREMLVQADGTWTLAVPLSTIAAHRPDNVKQLIDIRLDRLGLEEQRILEVASAIGSPFQTALVAHALEISIEQADELCDSLARRALFLRHEGTEEWPDGSQQSCYGFTHGLVQDVCAERNVSTRRQRWSRRIAECLEAAYGERAHEIATELALHYERAQVAARAIHYHVLSGERMVQRFASVTALPSFQRALALLPRLPESRERDATELRILGGMSSAALRLSRFEDAWLARFERMIALARGLGDHETCCTAMISLSIRYCAIGRYEDANAVNDELVALAATSLDPTHLPAISATRALPLFWQGRVHEAIALLEPLTRPDSQTERDAGLGILDPAGRKIALISYLGASYWVAGETDRGLAEIERANRAAIETGDPYTIGLTTINLARIRFLRGESVALIRALAEKVSTQADAQQWQAQATLLLAWADSTEAPLSAARLDDMVALYHERTGNFPMGASYVALSVIDALRRSSQRERALAFADAAIARARETGELVFEPELVRMRGTLVEDAAAAASSYREAVERAERLGLLGIAARARASLGELG